LGALAQLGHAAGHGVAVGDRGEVGADARAHIGGAEDGGEIQEAARGEVKGADLERERAGGGGVLRRKGGNRGSEQRAGEQRGGPRSSLNPCVHRSGTPQESCCRIRLGGAVTGVLQAADFGMDCYKLMTTGAGAAGAARGPPYWGGEHGISSSGGGAAAYGAAAHQPRRPGVPLGAARA